MTFLLRNVARWVCLLPHQIRAVTISKNHPLIQLRVCCDIEHRLLICFHVISDVLACDLCQGLHTFLVEDGIALQEHRILREVLLQVNFVLLSEQINLLLNQCATHLAHNTTSKIEEVYELHRFIVVELKLAMFAQIFLQSFDWVFFFIFDEI
jgi:hypothetical protein